MTGYMTDITITTVTITAVLIATNITIITIREVTEIGATTNIITEMDTMVNGMVMGTMEASTMAGVACMVAVMAEACMAEDMEAVMAAAEDIEDIDELNQEEKYDEKTICDCSFASALRLRTREAALLLRQR